MPGPNSAPNGDRGLILGSENERFIWCSVCERIRSARLDGHAHRNLKTGKTDLKRNK